MLFLPRRNGCEIGIPPPLLLSLHLHLSGCSGGGGGGGGNEMGWACVMYG